MKKFYSLIAVAAMTVAVNAQTPAFAGADFEDFAAFEAGLNKYGLKDYATQGVGQGVNGSNSLEIKTAGATRNDYVFTATATGDLPSDLTTISFSVKGTAGKSLSLNVYKEDGSYYPFNVDQLDDMDVTLEAAGSNQYAGGTIDTKGKWVKVTLNVEGLADINTTKTEENFFALKIGKDVDYNINLDNFEVTSASQGVIDLSGNFASVIKNSVVNDVLLVGANVKAQVYNVSGQVVKTFEASENSAVNVADLAKGVYIVKGEANGKAFTQKVVKK